MCNSNIIISVERVRRQSDRTVQTHVVLRKANRSAARSTQLHYVMIGDILRD